MKADKKVRWSVTVPKREGEKLRSFPYFASCIVSCLLDELFKRVSVADIAKEISADAGDVNVKMKRLRGCISKAFSDPCNKEKEPATAVKRNFWKVMDDA